MNDLVLQTPSLEAQVVSSNRSDECARLALELEDLLGVAPAVWCAKIEEVIVPSAFLSPSFFEQRVGLLCEVALRKEMAFVEDFSPWTVIAIPLAIVDDEDALLIVPARTDRSTFESVSPQLATLMGWPVEVATASMAKLPFWTGEQLQRLGRQLQRQQRLHHRANQKSSELATLSSHLVNTYEEISLLHQLTEHLSLSRTARDFGELAVTWLEGVLSVESIVLELLPSEGDQAHHFVTSGECPIPTKQLEAFRNTTKLDASKRPLVCNHKVTKQPSWQFPEVSEVVAVEIERDERVLGWLYVFNCTGKNNSNSEFGTVEASLLSSVASMLAIHGSNLDLYHGQSTFFDEVVRAMTSAIDAKDPYTCGHSDRVARVSVCLGRQLGLNSDELNTMYLSGLLHDIGKIGIDDNVLRKPGALTEAEFEHIKSHPELGHRILSGVSKLDHVMPIVLHHHEAWDGSGYPHRLKGEDAPFLARICAVADAYDAMSSDRPYRKGMSDEKLDSIIRKGAGQQWDAKVVAAFFEVREEIRQIGRSSRQSLSLNVEQWR